MEKLTKKYIFKCKLAACRIYVRYHSHTECVAIINLLCETGILKRCNRELKRRKEYIIQHDIDFNGTGSSVRLETYCSGRTGMYTLSYDDAENLINE